MKGLLIKTSFGSATLATLLALVNVLFITHNNIDSYEKAWGSVIILGIFSVASWAIALITKDSMSS